MGPSRRHDAQSTHADASSAHSSDPSERSRSSPTSSRSSDDKPATRFRSTSVSLFFSGRQLWISCMTTMQLVRDVVCVIDLCCWV
jgi:hypothetical protein